MPSLSSGTDLRTSSLSQDKAPNTPGAASGAAWSRREPAPDGNGDGPAVRLLNQILLDAAARNASDLHFERGQHDSRIRLRIDGVLHLGEAPPSHLRDALLARIKALSGLDVAEHRIPQDGRLSVRLRPGCSEDFRVSTLPTVHGEKVVLRRLDTLPDKLDIAQIGLSAAQQPIVREALDAPHGLLLVTGPTGSGKSLSLFCFMQSINHPSINICTVEDPVELRLPGINQVNVRDKAGLGFASVLRAFLRQDPDVLMIGEIRDTETADIAVKAAQTGHRVLSTLHTNDAPSAIVRLRDIGVAPYKLASGLRLVTAQRLVRKLCPICRIADPSIPERWHPAGCPACHGIGYRGRLGIHQLMHISDNLRDRIIAGASTTELTAQAMRDGMGTLLDAAMPYVRNGETSLNEAQQVAGTPP